MPAHVLILLTCFVQGADWKPPETWQLVSVTHHADSTEVHLQRTAQDGDMVGVPAGCPAPPAAPPTFRFGDTLLNVPNLTVPGTNRALTVE